MQYNQKQLLKLFIEENPQYTLEEVKSFINLYWNTLKSRMESNKLQKLRIKYFGVFEVRKGKVDSFHKFIEATKNVTEDSVHNKYKKMIEDYYKNYK
jgi:nucleoid DNA-binding protein